MSDQTSLSYEAIAFVVFIVFDVLVFAGIFLYKRRKNKKVTGRKAGLIL